MILTHDECRKLINNGIKNNSHFIPVKEDGIIRNFFNEHSNLSIDIHYNDFNYDEKSIEQYIEEIEINENEIIPEHIKMKMIESNSVYQVTFNLSSLASITVYHYDLYTALLLCSAAYNENNSKKV